MPIRKSSLGCRPSVASRFCQPGPIRRSRRRRQSCCGRAAPVFRVAGRRWNTAHRSFPVCGVLHPIYRQPFSVLDFRLSWSHYLKLMRIDDIAERQFYEIEAANNNWSLSELQRQYDSALYQRLALSRDKQGIFLMQNQ